VNNTTIVVPCFNEAQRLDVERFRRFAANQHALRFLFVNDGSSDRTLQILQQLHEEEPAQFDVLNLDVNSGKAEAVRRGLLTALNSEADFVGFWDADLATPLDAIPVFRFVMLRRDDIDIVVGTRIPLLGRSIKRLAKRKFLGRVFANVASLALGIGIYDTQCGAKLFRASPELANVLQDAFISRWIFDVEILARLIDNRRGTQPAVKELIYEQPLEHWEDVAGSRVKPADFFKAAGELAAIYWRYLRPGLPKWKPAKKPVAQPRPSQAPRRAA